VTKRFLEWGLNWEHMQEVIDKIHSLDKVQTRRKKEIKEGKR
jgi:hypothetical protein